MSDYGIAHEFLYEVLLITTQPGGVKALTQAKGEDSETYQKRLVEFGDKARSATTKEEQDELRVLSIFALMNISYLTQQELATAGARVFIGKDNQPAGEA